MDDLFAVAVISLIPLIIFIVMLSNIGAIARSNREIAVYLDVMCRNQVDFSDLSKYDNFDLDNLVKYGLITKEQKSAELEKRKH